MECVSIHFNLVRVISFETMALHYEFFEALTFDSLIGSEHGIWNCVSTALLWVFEWDKLTLTDCFSNYEINWKVKRQYGIFPIQWNRTLCDWSQHTVPEKHMHGYIYDNSGSSHCSKFIVWYAQNCTAIWLFRKPSQQRTRVFCKWRLQFDRDRQTQRRSNAYFSECLLSFFFL